tara:strand:- start:270 stop:452 length:183 start_codon:yes stop_codon:yes gene_type:complete
MGRLVNLGRVTWNCRPFKDIINEFTKQELKNNEKKLSNIIDPREPKEFFNIKIKKNKILN